MDQQQIQDTIQAEMNAFMQKPFPAILPVWLIQNFEKIVMELPQGLVPYRADTIQGILNKKSVNDLTFFETGLLVNLWLETTPKLIDSSIHKYLLKKSTLEQIRGQWNMLKNTEEERLQRKARSFAENNKNRILRN